MDVTGGSNYLFMGTNQMMSVPYALYAESANINYDSLANIISNDSTFITSIGGASGDGCNYAFPEGFSGEGINRLINANNNSYTVQAGERLYITNFYDGNTGFYINNILVATNQTSGLPIIANEGDIITAYNNSTTLYFNGYIVDENYFADCEGSGGNSSGNTPAVNGIIYTIDGF